MRVIVCGSRRWWNRETIIERLADLPPDSTIVHGNAKGADRIANQEAQKLGLEIELHDYRPFIALGVSPKRAPLLRNAHMAACGADLCIAFWDGTSSGTMDMVGQAEDWGIPVEIIKETV